MKRFIFLFALFNSAALLVAQNSSSGSGRAATAAPAGQQRAQTVPASTAPVQSSPAQGGVGVNRPVAAGVLESGATATTQTGADSGSVGGSEASAQGATSSDATGAAGAIDDTTPQPRAASGVEPLNPVLAPPLDSVPPPIRSDIQSQTIEEAAGAVNSTTQGTGASSTSTLSSGNRNGAVVDGAFAQQIQSATTAQGTTQVAFPQENAVITVISQDGNLTLQGAVGSEQQRANLEQAFRGISAGSFIDNQIRVVGPSSTTAE